MSHVQPDSFLTLHYRLAGPQGDIVNTFGGQPAEGATVTFNPQGANPLKNAAPSATVKADGTFDVGLYGNGDGAPAGDYVVTVQWFKVVTDYYLKVESQTKALKECSMNEQFRVRFEEGLQKIAASLTKKGGVKQEVKVHERIGRLRQKYPSIQRYFDIETEVKDGSPIEGKKKVAAEGDDGKRIVGSIKWTVKEDVEINARSGVYFLRTPYPVKLLS